MDVPHPRLLIFATALICSAGMGLPISGLSVAVADSFSLSALTRFLLLAAPIFKRSSSFLPGVDTILLISPVRTHSINVEDDMGQRYLEPSDFFKNGIPASVIATIVVITVGYGIMRALGM